MRVYGKVGNEIIILARPEEEIRQGDYLLLEDVSKKMKMVTQAYEEMYVETPGLQEEILRDEVMDTSLDIIEHDSLNIRGISHEIRDYKLLRCKIRGSINGAILKPSTTWLPSRVDTKVTRLSLTELFLLVDRNGQRGIELGSGITREKFQIFAEDLDGSLNIVSGKKGSGKSHLSKHLVAGLAKFGAPVVIFDLNDEYGGLAQTRSGDLSPLSDNIFRLVPGRSLRFTMKNIGLNAIHSVFQHALDLPAASLREFTRIWKYLDERNSLNIDSLGTTIENWRCNEFVRDALLTRYHTLCSTGLIGDNDNSASLEDIINGLSHGGLIIISLAKISSLTRRIAVEVILSNLVGLLESERIRPVFLFAEESHLYLRETYWDDIVTRMRHFGMFTTFITNQPDAIPNSIYRQADNIFLFNFTNDSDIELVSKASMVDAETVKSIVRTLPPRSCLSLGKMVNDLPVILDIKESNWMSLGETKLFFREPMRITSSTKY